MQTKTVYLCSCECIRSFAGRCLCLLWRISCQWRWSWRRAGHRRSGWREGRSRWTAPPQRNGTQPSAFPPSSLPHQSVECDLHAVLSCASSSSPTKSPLHKTPHLILFRDFFFFFLNICNLSLTYWSRANHFIEWIICCGFLSIFNSPQLKAMSGASITIRLLYFLLRDALPVIFYLRYKYLHIFIFSGKFQTLQLKGFSKYQIVLTFQISKPLLVFFPGLVKIH